MKRKTMTILSEEKTRTQDILKPCPYCGNHAQVKVVNAEQINTNQVIFNLTIKCKKCGVEVPKTNHPYRVGVAIGEYGAIEILNDSRVELENAWNKREDT